MRETPPHLFFRIEMAEQPPDLPEEIIFSIVRLTKVMGHAFLFRSWYVDPKLRTELLVSGFLGSDRMKREAESSGVPVSNAALKEAAKNGHVDVCKALMDPAIAGKTTFAVARDGNSAALKRAAENGHLDVCKALMDPAIAGKTTFAVARHMKSLALYRTAENGHLDVCKALMDPALAGEATFAVARDNDSAALRYAAENGHLDVCKALMDPAIAGKTTFAVARDKDSAALRNAAANGHLDVCKALMDPSIAGETTFAVVHHIESWARKIDSWVLRHATDEKECALTRDTFINRAEKCRQVMSMLA